MSHSCFFGIFSWVVGWCRRLRPLRGGSCTFLYVPIWLKLNILVFLVVVGWVTRSMGSPIMLSSFGAPHVLRFVSSLVRFVRDIWSFVSAAIGVMVVVCVGCGQGGVLIGRIRFLVGCVVGFAFGFCVVVGARS